MEELNTKREENFLDLKIYIITALYNENKRENPSGPITWQPKTTANLQVIFSHLATGGNQNEAYCLQLFDHNKLVKGIRRRRCFQSNNTHIYNLSRMYSMQNIMDWSRKHT